MFSGCISIKVILGTNNEYKSTAFKTILQRHWLYITLRQGIDKELAKKITTLIKQSKIKVQAAIQGDSVRITGKKRDELQQVIQIVKDQNYDIPLQFINFRD